MVLLMLQRMCPLYHFLGCGMCHMSLENLEVFDLYNLF